MKRSFASCLCLLSLLPCMTIAASYRIQPLGMLPGFASSGAYALNGRGQVVGTLWEPVNFDQGQPFVWDTTSGMRLLSTEAGSYGRASDINDSGYIAGTSANMACRWDSNGNRSNIGVAPGDSSSKSVGINNLGQVAGRSYPSGAPSQQFLWTEGVGMTVLPVPGADNAQVYDVDDHGNVVGFVYNSQGVSRTALWNASTDWNLVGNALPGYEKERPVAMSDNGMYIAGYASHQFNPGTAFIWDTTSGLRQLPTLGGGDSEASGVNNLGQVVGIANGQACLWKDGVVYDLSALLPSDSGWTLNGASDINDSGWIVGVGTYQGVEQAFVLVPVPEPSSIIAILSGLGSLLACRRRRA